MSGNPHLIVLVLTSAPLPAFVQFDKLPESFTSDFGQLPCEVSYSSFVLVTSQLNNLLTTAGCSKVGRTTSAGKTDSRGSCSTGNGLQQTWQNHGRNKAQQQTPRMSYGRKLLYKLLTEESEKIFSGSWFAALRLLPDSNPL